MNKAASEVTLEGEIHTPGGQPPQTRGHAYSSLSRIYRSRDFSRSHTKEETGIEAKTKRHLCLAAALGFDCCICLY